MNLVGFRIVRILLVKVSEEKVLPNWAARALSDDVWLSAVFLTLRCPSVVLVRVVRDVFAKKKKIFFETPVFYMVG